MRFSDIKKMKDATDVDGLIGALQEKKATKRYLGAEALGEIGDPKALEPLMNLLKDKKWDVRRNAAQALGNIGDPRAVEPLTKTLKDKNPGVRGDAAQALGKIGKPAVEPLIAAMCAPVKENPYYYNQLLGLIFLAVWIGSAVMIISLLGWYIAIGVILGLIIGSAAAFGFLSLFDKSTEDVPELAAEALGKIGVPTVQPLLAALKDESRDPISAWEVRQRVSNALSKIGEPAVEPLIAALKEENSQVRSCVAGVMYEIGNSRVVEPLIDVLDDKDKEVRQGVAAALRKIGDTRAVEPLIKTLIQENDELTRETITEALEKLGCDQNCIDKKVKNLILEPIRRHLPVDEILNRQEENLPPSEIIKKLFDKRSINPEGKEILAIAFLYKQKPAPYVWTGSSPDPYAANPDNNDLKQLRFLLSKILPGFQPHYIPGHLRIGPETLIAGRQFEINEKIDAAYINQTLANMLAELMEDHNMLEDLDLCYCSALSLSGNSVATGEARIAVLVR